MGYIELSVLSSNFSVNLKLLYNINFIIIFLSLKKNLKELTFVSTLWKVTEARCSEKETNQMNFQHWETKKNKARGQENGGILERVSFLLNLGFLPGSCRKCSSLPCPPNLKERVCLRANQSKDQRLCVKQGKAKP